MSNDDETFPYLEKYLSKPATSTLTSSQMILFWKNIRPKLCGAHFNTIYLGRSLTNISKQVRKILLFKINTNIIREKHHNRTRTSSCCCGRSRCPRWRSHSNLYFFLTARSGLRLTENFDRPEPDPVIEWDKSGQVLGPGTAAGAGRDSPPSSSCAEQRPISCWPSPCGSHHRGLERRDNNMMLRCCDLKY